MKHKKTNQNVKHRKTSHHRRKQNGNRRHPESTLHLNRRIGADGTFRTGFLIPEETSHSAQEPITGIIEKHARGFAFLRREEGADIFIAPDNLGGAMNGDTAQVELLPPYLWTKSKEGIIVKILERATKEVVGTFQKKKGFGFVVPDDRKLTEDIYIKQDAFRSAANGDKVVAKITQYPDKQHRIEGKITEIVARKGETGSDVLSLIRGYGLFQTFPSRVNAEAKARGREKITDEEIARRLDLRGKNIFTIDGPEAKIIRTGDTSVELRIFAGEVYYNLEPRRLFPLSGLTKYITLLDRENKEKAIIRDISTLDKDSRAALEGCLDEYYMIPRIKRFIKMREKFLIWMWTVETDRGICTFEIRNHLTAVKPLYDGRILIKDANDNRYEIPDVRKLDKKSRKMIDPKI